MADIPFNNFIGSGSGFIPNDAVISGALTTGSSSFVDAFNVTESCIGYGATLVIPASNPAIVAEMRITRDGEVLSTINRTGSTTTSTVVPFLGNTDISNTLQTRGMTCLSSLRVEARRISGSVDIQCQYTYQTGELT